MKDHAGTGTDATVATRESEGQYPAGWRLAVIITSLCLGTLLIALDNTILTVAIPKITTVFNSLNDVGWYGSAYLLSITALQPTFGNFYKYFDVKVVYLVSIAIFEGMMTSIEKLSCPQLTREQLAPSYVLQLVIRQCSFSVEQLQAWVRPDYSKELWVLSDTPSR